MNNRYLVAFSAALLSGSVLAVGPVTNLQPLALDGLGHPRLQWTRVSGAASYIVERRSDTYPDGDTACLSTRETLDGGWCRFSVPAGTGSAPFVFTDSNVRVDPSSPVEYQYRIAAADDEDNESTFVNRWANSCPIAVANPETAYLDSVRDASNSAILTAADIPATEGVSVKSISIGGGQYYVLSNDKYIALFGRKGSLLSLTHRNYGKDFVAVYKNQTTGNLYKSDGVAAWVIKLINNSSTGGVQTSAESPSISATPTLVAGGIQFTWINASGYDITATWTLQSLGMSGLHAKVTAVPNGSPTPGLDELRFPFVQGLAYDQVDLLWPKDIGRKIDGYPYNSDNAQFDPARAKSGGLFSSTSMQFMGISYPIDASNGNLLYIGAEDPDLRPKGFFIQPNALSEANNINSPTQPAGFFMTNYPLNGTGLSTSKIDASTHNYELVMQPMCGDIAKVAKRYRKYAEQQEWVRIGQDKTMVGGDSGTKVLAKTAARIDVPQKLKEGVFWWTQNNGSSQTLAFMKDYANDTLSYSAVGLKEVMGPAVGVDVGIHLYNWHSPGTDHNNPEFTERAGGPTDLAGYMSAVEADGTLVMPYINATNVDIDDLTKVSYTCEQNTGTVSPTNSYVLVLPQQTCGWWYRPYTVGGVAYNTQDQLTYKSSGASKSEAVYIDTYSGQNVGVARLDSAFWTSITNLNVSTVFNSGANGVYLDTFGSLYRPDYASLWGVTTGKPIGHDKDWRTDMAALAVIARTVGDQRDTLAGTPNKRFVGAEHFGEGFIRDVDLFTLYSDHPISTYPLAQLVYSDYQLFAGPQGRVGDTNEARRLRYGRAFTWGIQPGLMGLDQLCGSDFVCSSAELSEVVAYMKTLTKARKSLVDFLGYGELLGVPVATDPTPVSTNWCDDQGCKTVESATLPAIEVGRWLSNNGERAFVATNTSLDTATTTIPVPPNWLGAVANCFDETRSAVSCAVVSGGNLVVSMPALSVRYISFGIENPDADGDGIDNAIDNCPAEYNPDQADINNNGIGDVCENGLTASYYNDTDTNSDGYIDQFDDKLVGTPVLQRIDPGVDFNVGSASPGSGVNADYFSVSWIGRLLVPAYTGTYHFCITGDDGVWLSVNGQEVLSAWKPQDSETTCGDIALTAGQKVPIEIDFFDLAGDALMHMTWSYPGQAEQVVPSANLYAQ